MSLGCDESRCVARRVGPVGLEPTTNGLTCHFGFHRHTERCVRGLDCPFTLAPKRCRCHPSSLYTFRGCPRLGSGLPRRTSPAGGSPTLSGVILTVSDQALLLKSAALPIELEALASRESTHGRRRSRPAY